jgi:hypothetical protein
VPDSATLIADAREVLRLKLLQLKGKEAIKKSNPAHIARIVEVCEKYHGESAADPSSGSPRAWLDRYEWLAGLGKELERRKLLTRKDPGTLDVNPSPGGEQATLDSASNPPMSDK